MPGALSGSSGSVFADGGFSWTKGPQRETQAHVPVASTGRRLAANPWRPAPGGWKRAIVIAEVLGPPLAARAGGAHPGPPLALR